MKSTIRTTDYADLVLHVRQPLMEGCMPNMSRASEAD